MSARDTPRPCCTGSRNTANVSGTPRAIRFIAKVRTTSTTRKDRCSGCSRYVAWSCTRGTGSDAAEPGHRGAEGEPLAQLLRGKRVVPGMALGQLREPGKSPEEFVFVAHGPA